MLKCCWSRICQTASTAFEAMLFHGLLSVLDYTALFELHTPVQMVLCQGRWRCHRAFSSFLSSIFIMSTLPVFSCQCPIHMSILSPSFSNFEISPPLVETGGREVLRLLVGLAASVNNKIPWNLLDSPVAFLRSLTGGRGAANIPCQLFMRRLMACKTVSGILQLYVTTCSNYLKQMASASLRFWVICPLNAHHLHLDLLLQGRVHCLPQIPKGLIHITNSSTCHFYPACCIAIWPFHRIIGRVAQLPTAHSV